MSSAKYLIRVKFEIEGLVEEHDVIGALFGQTEGLLAPDLDLRNLLKSGRIGRVKVDLEHTEEKTVATVTVPSNLSRIETALLAASIETIDRVGPFVCKAELEEIVNAREELRKSIIDRAKEILREWTLRSTPKLEEVVREVSEAAEVPRIISYGIEGLPAGPEIEGADSIIVVEGRADVAHLLELGYYNVIALGGAKVPETIISLSKEKEVTLFLDGDKAADMILRDVLLKADIDFVARAPKGKEVEELTAKEVAKALRERVLVTKEFIEEVVGRVEAAKPEEVPIEVPDQIYELVSSLRDTLEAVLLDNEMKQIARFPTRDLVEKLEGYQGVHTIVFDGIITPRLVDVAKRRGVRCLIAERISNEVKPPYPLELLTFSRLIRKHDS